MDVGCGNGSPQLVKAILKNVQYTGIDIAFENTSVAKDGVNLVRTDSANFARTLESVSNGEKFDVVLSSHNLEHCVERERVLQSMLKAVAPEGKIYISFPSEKSIDFPSRQGTLNYYDDSTHLNVPPDYNSVLNLLGRSGFQVLFSSCQYRPLFLSILGFFLEPLSKRKGKIAPGTWEYYGFESVIWAVRLKETHQQNGESL